MADITPTQLRTIDPFASYYSNVVNRMFEFFTEGNNYLSSANSMQITIDSTSPEDYIVIGTGYCLKDNVTINYTENFRVDMRDIDFYKRGSVPFNEAGYYYICLNYTYEKKKPPNEASVQILKPTQQSYLDSDTGLFFLGAVEVDSTSVDGNIDFVIVDTYDHDPNNQGTVFRKILFVEVQQHNLTHIKGGQDEVDGDRLDIDWDPSNYNPDNSPPQVNSNDHLTSHLKGVDNKFSSISSSISNANNNALNHSTRHITGQSDEIDGDKLDIDWNPTNYTPDTSPSQVNNVDNLTAHLKGIDNKFPTKASTSHSGTHITGSSDEIDGDKLDIDWNPTNYTPDSSPSQTDNVNNLTAHLKGIDDLFGSGSVSTHASTHITGQSDEIDGDKLDIDWNPTNYTPSTSPSEVDNVDNLTAHLKGIDDVLNPKYLTEISEPSDPFDGNSIIYMSDGSAPDETEGDIIVKVSVSGTTKKSWLFSF